MSDTQPVLFTVENGVGTITLNRPEAMNSLNIATKEALLDAVQRAAADDEVRVVVLTGTGRAFCVGQDLKEHIELLEAGDSQALFTTVERHYNPTVLAIATMGKPVVALLNGVAAGAGASLALACDFRILRESAAFNFAFTGVALSCDTGASWTLQRIVGRNTALELLYFPKTHDAAASLALGLATQVVADVEWDEVVGKLVGRLATGPTLSYGAIRRSLEFSSSHDLAESLAFEGSMMTLTGASADHRAAVAAFLAKEKPAFEGR